MTTKPAPLLFSQVLAAKRLDQLTAGHGLTQPDLDWLRHASLPSHAQRAAKTPPMFAETIMLQAGKKTPIALAGCFALSARVENSESDTQPAFIYTPMGGIRKFDNRASLEAEIERMWQDNEHNDLYSFLSISQRSELKSTADIAQTRQIIDGDIIQAQHASIESAQDLNALTMVKELIQLPSLKIMLDRILKETHPTIDYRQARVALGKGTRSQGAEDIGVTESIPLIEAILIYFHNQGWPAGHYSYITFPGTPDSPYSVQQWQDLIRGTAAKLVPAITGCIEDFWAQTATSLYLTRRELLSRIIHDGLQASIVIKREKEQLTVPESHELFRVLSPSSQYNTPLYIETIRFWEYEPSFVELAGSLMISGKGHYLYTPEHGLQKLDGFRDFKYAILDKSSQVVGKEAIYSLLDLDERNRFLRFDDPQLSGKAVDFPVPECLADAIIQKQKNNLRFALDMSRQGDVDIHALVDKALDIRAFIGKELLNQPTDGHWGTHPAFYGLLRPSNLKADQLERKGKSYTDIEKTFDTLLTQLATPGKASLRNRPRQLLKELTNIFSLGIRAEAELKELNGTLPSLVNELIKTVFTYDVEYPDRSQRPGVRGFQPDVYSLRLEYSDETATIQMPLANCFLLTERGGLDTPYSGMAVLWTPAQGLQVFASVEVAIRQLNGYLLDSRSRFGILANLPSVQRKPHGRYQLQGFELIEENVLLNRMNSFVDLYEAEHGYLNTLKAGIWQPTEKTLMQSLVALLEKGAPTNLGHATRIAQSDRLRQKLPAWLGTAALEEQRLHLELLEQYKNSVGNGEDYLDGIEPLRTHVLNKLQTLLDKRFAQSKVNPETVQITPTLAVVGPTLSLTDFVLRHVDVTSKSFKVSSTSTQPLPDGLDETAVRQMLSSLDITTLYKQNLTQALMGTTEAVQARRRRFRQQLPWQLLQYAHARYLQQHLSSPAFDLLRQVLDMPDAVARQLVKNAKAIIRPLELIKTDAAAAVKALGLYLFSSSGTYASTHVLYAPYHDGPQLIEFKDEASIVAAFNTPGTLQDMLIRRLPNNQQATFKNLFASTLGQLSEVRLASNPINTNAFDTLYEDNATLLANMLDSRTQAGAHFDWSTFVHVLKTGARLIGKELPAKVTFVETLWESYEDFKASSEALQAHDWKAGLHNFIAGAAEMVSLGFLNRDDTFGLLDPIEPTAPGVAPAPAWKNIASTSAPRTDMQIFETMDVSLSNLKKLPDGTFQALGSNRFYAPLAGKVYEVAKYADTWRIIHGVNQGPLLRRSSDGQAWEIDPKRHTIRFGKSASKLAIAYTDLKARGSLNIEARGMTEIRRKYPHRANIIVQALETARFYSFNALHNLGQLKQSVIRGSRLDRFLRLFFGVNQVDSRLLAKIEAAISPICTELADPSWILKNADRVAVGDLRYMEDRATAFVIDPNARGRIYLTQFFFDPGLDWFKTVVPNSFNVDAHAQGATFIHELSHQHFNTLDIIYLDAAFPFLDMISTVTHLAKQEYDRLEKLQSHGLSLTTPKAKLFTQWDSADNTSKSLEFIPVEKATCREILKITGAQSMNAARDAFLDPISPDKRIEVILRNADSITLLICEMGRQLEAPPSR